VEKISWTDRVSNEEVLQRTMQERNKLHNEKRRFTELDISCVGTAF